MREKGEEEEDKRRGEGRKRRKEKNVRMGKRRRQRKSRECVEEKWKTYTRGLADLHGENLSRGCLSLIYFLCHPNFCKALSGLWNSSPSSLYSLLPTFSPSNPVL